MAAITLAPTGLPCTPDAADDFLARPTPAVVAAVAHMEGPFLVLGAGGKLGLHLSLMLHRGLNALGRQLDAIPGGKNRFMAFMMARLMSRSTAGAMFRKMMGKALGKAV